MKKRWMVTVTVDTYGNPVHWVIANRHGQKGRHTRCGRYVLNRFMQRPREGRRNAYAIALQCPFCRTYMAVARLYRDAHIQGELFETQD